MPRKPLPTPNEPAITNDTPLRLRDAAAIAYPMGGMTVSALRKEAQRGRLVIERVAGKDFTTLGAIERMRALCEVPPAERAPSEPAPPSSPAIPGCTPQEAARALFEKLKKRKAL